jgi:hypothetical protein
MSLLMVAFLALIVLGGIGLVVAVVLVARRGAASTPPADDDFSAGTPPAPPAAAEPAPAPAAAPAPVEAPAPAVAPVAAPVEAPAPPAEPAAAPAATAPAAALAAAPEPVPAGGVVQMEKLRIADLGLILWANRLRLGDEDVLAFVTEGFAARGREELVLYVKRSACPDADIVRALKRFAALALIVLERLEPVKLGELLKVPGEVGAVPLGGYLAVEPNEPGDVPFGARFVLIGLPRRALTGDAATIRAGLVAESGGAPWLTVL